MVSERDTHSITEGRHVTWGFLLILCSTVTPGVMDGSSFLPQVFLFRKTHPKDCPICSSKFCQVDSQDQQHRNIYKEFSVIIKLVEKCQNILAKEQRQATFFLFLLFTKKIIWVHCNVKGNRSQQCHGKCSAPSGLMVFPSSLPQVWHLQDLSTWTLPCSSANPLRLCSLLGSTQYLGVRLELSIISHRTESQ